MGVDILPKDPRQFKYFKKKFNELTYHPGGEFGMLRNNRTAIEAAITKRAGTIKIKGGLDRLQRKSALLEIMKNDKTLTKADKVKVKELLDYYARGQKDTKAVVKKPVVNMERDDSELITKSPNFAHVSNANFFREGNQTTGQSVMTPGGDSSVVSRGLVARNALNYSRAQRLGSGEAARNLQKAAFSKLQSSSKPLTSLGGVNQNLIHPLK
jgi:hypothetical protein